MTALIEQTAPPSVPPSDPNDEKEAPPAEPVAAKEAPEETPVPADTTGMPEIISSLSLPSSYRVFLQMGGYVG